MGTFTRKGLLPVVTITKNDASTYTCNPHTSVFDFRLRTLSCTPVFDNTAGRFSVTITSANASNASMNTILSNISEGNEIVIWVGKTDATKVKVYRGMIETITISEPNKNYMDVTLEGMDWGSTVLKGRIVNGSRIQKVQADGTTLDNTDDTVQIYQLAADMLQDSEWYPSGADGITAENQGIVVTTTNITPPNMRLPQFYANMEKLDDKLTELDNFCSGQHYVDPDKNFIMYQPGVEPLSGSTTAKFLFTDDINDSVAAAWASDKWSVIAPGSEYVRTLENHNARIFGLGGNQKNKDQVQETVTNSTDLFPNYLAVRFTPTKIECESIAVYVKKVGTPSTDLVLELRENVITAAYPNGAPIGSALRSVSKSKDALTTSPVWTEFQIGESLNTAKSYWIILLKNIGFDAGNTYTWYRDNGTAYARATSADGITWTIDTTDFGHAFRVYYNEPLLTIYPETTLTASTKHFVEDVIRKPDITNRTLLQFLIEQEAKTQTKKKEMFKGRVYAPDALMKPGDKVRIRKQASGYIVDTDFILGQMEYRFASDDPTGALWLDITCTRFTDFS